MTVDDLKAEVSRLLCLEDDSIVDLLCICYVSHFIEGDPVWLMIVGAPSSGKTEVLSGLMRSKGIYPLSNLTPNTFISGWSEKKRRINTKVEDSLLFKIDGKILVMKDFTTVLQMRMDNRAEILSQLREIYDGRYSKAFGIKQEVFWEGKLGFIAGVTPAIYRHQAFMAGLGPRFVYYEMRDRDEKKATLHSLRSARSKTDIRRTSMMAFKDFLKGIDVTDISYPLEAAEEGRLADLAILVAHSRTAVFRDSRHQIEMRPMLEGGGRLVNQFEKLFQGACRVYGVGGMTDRIWSLIRRVGLMSIPKHRREALGFLWRGLRAQRVDDAKIEYPCGTNQLTRLMNVPKSVVSRTLEDLQMIGMLEKDRGRWLLEGETVEVLEGLGLNGGKWL